MPPPKPSMLVDAYQAFTEAGDKGLSAKELRAVFDPETKSRVAAAQAGRCIRSLLSDGGIELAGSGRWVALPGWTKRDNNAYVPLVDKLPEPVIGVDVSEEEYHKHRTARGRSSKPPGPVDIDPALFALMTPEEQRRYRLYQAVNHEDDWRTWVPAMFPTRVSAPFAVHHAEFWDHVWGIDAGRPAVPAIAVWSRGAGKSMSVEMAVAALGALKRRRYCLYISSAQLRADDHVKAIEGLLLSETMQIAYPEMANPEIGMHGQAKAWRRNRLRTASGFVVDALGLDVAVRGVRIDEQRPDLLVFDEVDDIRDTPAMIRKKIQAITRNLLPTGAQYAAMLGVQNKVHDQSIFARLISTGQPGEPEPAEFLIDRKVTGPIPAVWNLQYEQRATDNGRFRYVITGGEPSWVGMPIESCQKMIDDYSIEAFLAECQHEELDLAGSMFGHLDFTPQGPIRVNETAIPKFVHTCVWVDPSGSHSSKSDSCGVIVDSLGADHNYYRRWAWEQIAAADEAIEVAVTAALDFGADVLGVETDYGGHAWEPIFRQVLKKVVDRRIEENGGEMPDGLRIPRYEYAKAGSAQMSKEERLSRMASEYNLGRFRHVGGQVVALERALRRFPEHKPYDLADAAWHGWQWLAKQGGNPNSRQRMRARAPRGAVGEVSAGL